MSSATSDASVTPPLSVTPPGQARRPTEIDLLRVDDGLGGLRRTPGP